MTNRLASALSSHSCRTSTGAADVAVLLRQCLRADDVRRGASTTNCHEWVRAWLEVPICQLFPESFDWLSYGLLPQRTAGGRFRISAEPWRPAWLDVPDGMSVDADAAAAIPRRIDETVVGDPFLNAIDASFSGYKTPGQRASVRSAMVLPDGATLVVNLPTGAGKTLAMLAAAETAPPGMTSVIVVPTVALALDQERRYSKQNPDSPATAYHGNLSDAKKKAFRERLWSGEQRVIFTNPEAIVASLARPLADAAGGGRLSLLAIDEAHIVGSWGDAFRPHFHSLAGLRRYMLRAAAQNGHPPFKTILASATLTQDVLGLLNALFGEPGPFLQVAAPVLRPEPSYWQSTNLAPEDRERRVLEALRHLPRPAIIYTTLRQEDRPGTYTPQKLARVLRAAGYQRLETVDGGSSTAHREKVLRGMRDDGGIESTIDLVVATSAFGLGIDVPDIRSIVHACVPEGIDRFYQEVGRSGRDGNASTSVLLATREDDRVASDLASPTYLTSERARERWSAMLLARRDAGDGLCRLPLTATSGKVRIHGSYNERWNLSTVILLARTGAVGWDFLFSGRDAEGELESDAGWLTVRILRGDHQTDQFWQDVAEPTRASMVENSRESLFRLRNAITGTVCIGVVTAESFAIDAPPELRTTCLVACGGCRWCRAHGKIPWASPSPIPAAIAVPPTGDKPSLDRLAICGAYGRRVVVYVDPSVLSTPRKLRQLLPSLSAAGGIRQIVAAESLVAVVRDIVAKSPVLMRSVMVDASGDYDPVTAVGVPTLFLLADGQDPEEFLEGNSRAPLTVICGTPDSPVGRDGLTLRDQDGSYAYADIEKL
ncbi:protein DpdF [Mycobacterium bohemicum]|uniref:protein DpdF n=1 Tax=Mycobacterium bohemicum TaxID=56425 RepID=UPI001111BE4B|nr:protein DpdF [Mycobacterium bohemicum]MCV6970085.1 DEAD/DEAH box helicase [Mycobacterium bohemicum]